MRSQKAKLFETITGLAFNVDLWFNGNHLIVPINHNNRWLFSLLFRRRDIGTETKTANLTGRRLDLQSDLFYYRDVLI